MLDAAFFADDACTVARKLLGSVIRRKHGKHWLAARIIETEAYYLTDKASHSSLGYTEKRKAMFMPPGTIYMYHARGHASLNISCGNEGDAVLIKAAFPVVDTLSPQSSLEVMQRLNPATNGTPRPMEKLCAGQTLLCRALAIHVADWDQKNFDRQQFYIEQLDYQPAQMIQTTRLGIPPHRDAHLPYRFIDYDYARYCSSNPLTKRKNQVMYAVTSNKF